MHRETARQSEPATTDGAAGNARSLGFGCVLTSNPDEEGALKLTLPFLHPTWKTRQPATALAAPFPGTAISFEDRWYEVFAHEAVATSSHHRYLLRPWDDAFPFRRTDELTAETCQAAARAAGVWRPDAGLWRLAAPFTGFLAADSQLDLQRRFGIPAVGGTLLSASLTLTVALAVLFFVTPLRLGFFLLAVYVLGESLLRLASALYARQPMGALPIVVFNVMADRRYWARRLWWDEATGRLDGFEPIPAADHRDCQR